MEYSEEEKISLLHAACKINSLSVARRLLSDSRVNLHELNGHFVLASPLAMAVKNGNLEMTKTLLERGANPDQCVKSMLGDSEFMSHYNHCLHFFKLGEDERYSANPLFEAVYRGHLEMVELLLKSGANVNFQEEYGKSPLHAAAIIKRFDLVKILVENGADLSLMDKNMETPLKKALIHKAPKEIIDLLQKNPVTSVIYNQNNNGNNELRAALVETALKS